MSTPPTSTSETGPAPGASVTPAVTEGAPRLARPPGAVLLRSERLLVGHGGRAILPPIDLTISAGEIWTVLGRNGAGKTTWFRTLLGLARPLGGTIVRARPDLRIAYVPQRTQFDELYPVRVHEVVRMGAERGRSVFGRSRVDVDGALAAVDALPLRDRPFRALSEGQKQRVLLARVCAARAELALLDEPTAAMDVVAEREAFSLLARLRAEHNMAVVVVSHYLDVARELADKALLLDREGQSVVVGTPAQVFDSETFHRAYGTSAEVCAHDSPPAVHDE